MIETGLTVGTRVSVTPDKLIPKKKKNIKSKDLSPFLTRNKRLLNEENYSNTETIDTSLSEKYDMSHTSTDDLTGKNTKKIQMMMTNTRRKLRKFKKVMKLLKEEIYKIQGFVSIYFWK